MERAVDIHRELNPPCLVVGVCDTALSQHAGVVGFQDVDAAETVEAH